MNKEEILYNEIYERTKDFGRTHFIKEIMRLQREYQQLKEIEKENQRLKLELSGYRQAILEDKDMLGLKEENQSLKKQLEENQNPLKGIFAQVNDDTLLRDCGNMNAEINELKNQQKEFIKWLENYLELFDYDNIDEQVGYDMIEEILKKYKSITGVSDEKEN